MSWLSNFLGGGSDNEESSGFKTQAVVDPLKQAVASPLSSYLASQIGKGLDKYPGDLFVPLDAATEKNYKNYTALDAGDYFTKNNQDPATAIFKRDFDATTREGYAGNLRGSGRFGAEEDAINRFSQGLATQRGTFVPEFNAKQVEMGKTYWGIKNAENQALVEDWYKTLPQNNPAINQALQYLNNQTSTGTDWLASVNNQPEQGNWFNDILNSLFTSAPSLGPAGNNEYSGVLTGDKWSSSDTDAAFKIATAVMGGF